MITQNCIIYWYIAQLLKMCNNSNWMFTLSGFFERQNACSAGRQFCNEWVLLCVHTGGRLRMYMYIYKWRVEDCLLRWLHIIFFLFSSEDTSNIGNWSCLLMTENLILIWFLRVLSSWNYGKVSSSSACHFVFICSRIWGKKQTLSVEPQCECENGLICMQPEPDHHFIFLSLVAQ